MFTDNQKIKILKLKSAVASYYNLTMKKIGDRQLEALFFENCVISGGCISALFHDEAVRDIDIYPKSVKALNLIKDYIINGEKNIKTVDSYDEEGTPSGNQFKLVTQNAVTLTNDIQFIYMDTWENCKKRFDFVHCLPHYDLATQKLYISESQYSAIEFKSLISTGYVELKDKRIQKYMARGWRHPTPTDATFSWSEAKAAGIIAQEIGKLNDLFDVRVVT